MGVRYFNRYLILLCILGFTTVYVLFNYDGTTYPSDTSAMKPNSSIVKPTDLFAIKPSSSIGIPNSPKVLILYYTPTFGRVEPENLSICSQVGQCEVTSNKSRMSEASAVIYHAYDLPKEFPELPDSYKFKNIFFTHENPVSVKRFSEVPPRGNFFHWIASYSLASDVVWKYGGYWVDPETAKRREFQPLNLPYDAESIFANKSIPGVFWLVSFCTTPSKREVAVAELAKHFRVDIAGKCATNDTLKTICPTGSNCHEMYKKYYFFMALENTECVDYISEKYWARYELPVVPIVMRRGIYEKHLPPGSFIAFDDYPNAKAMADHLTYLVGNQTAYLEYFKYRVLGWTLASNSEGYYRGWCNLCHKLISTLDAPKPPIIDDVHEHYAKMAPCQGSEFADKWVRN